ncbi:MAG: FeoB-associated Cys-rich membrane protein [Bacteroidetes bacterium]|nr:FeoB-associated Cys-rich membrane protein [Bacteroidota bacterium]
MDWQIIVVGVIVGLAAAYLIKRAIPSKKSSSCNKANCGCH